MEWIASVNMRNRPWQWMSPSVVPSAGGKKCTAIGELNAAKDSIAASNPVLKQREQGTISGTKSFCFFSSLGGKKTKNRDFLPIGEEWRESGSINVQIRCCHSWFISRKIQQYCPCSSDDDGNNNSCCITQMQSRLLRSPFFRLVSMVSSFHYVRNERGGNF